MRGKVSTKTRNGKKCILSVLIFTFSPSIKDARMQTN